jgi:glucosylceramidase
MKKIKVIGSILLLLGALSGCSATVEHNTKSDADQPIQLQNKIEFAEQYITAQGTDYRLSETGSLTFSSAEQPDEHFPTLIVDPKKTYQTIVGFGGALTDASAETFYKLSKRNQEKIISAYFSTTEGIGYNLFRTHINSCDFSSESYAYCETYGDINLDHFTINRDKKYRIPLIKTALENAGENFNLLASPWSPPAWMKTNNHMLQGGKLKPEYFQTWAD